MHLQMKVWGSRGSVSYASYFLFHFVDFNICFTCLTKRATFYGAMHSSCQTSNAGWGHILKGLPSKCLLLRSFHRHVLHVRHQLANELLIEDTLAAPTSPLQASNSRAQSSHATWITNQPLLVEKNSSLSVWHGTKRFLARAKQKGQKTE